MGDVMAGQELYTTIVGLKNYEGSKVFKIGSSEIS